MYSVRVQARARAPVARRVKRGEWCVQGAVVGVKERVLIAWMVMVRRDSIWVATWESVGEAGRFLTSRGDLDGVSWVVEAMVILEWCRLVPETVLLGSVLLFNCSMHFLWSTPFLLLAERGYIVSNAHCEAVIQRETSQLFNSAFQMDNVVCSVIVDKVGRTTVRESEDLQCEVHLSLAGTGTCRHLLACDSEVIVDAGEKCEKVPFRSYLIVASRGMKAKLIGP